jgi:hypothetical protein
VLDGFTTTVWCEALSTDGKYLAAGGAFDPTGKIPSIRVWTLPDRKELFPVERPAGTIGAKLNPPWKPTPKVEAVAETAKPDEKKPEEKKSAADKKPEAKKPDEKKPAADAKPQAKTPTVEKKTDAEKKPASDKKPEAKKPTDNKKEKK